MSSYFFTGTRGCVYTVSEIGGGKGFYALDELKASDVLVLGSDLSIGDIASPLTTLNRDRIMYSFGVDWGRAEIQGLVLLGEGGAAGEGDSLTALIDFFNKHRLANADKPCSLSIPGDKAFNVWLHRLTIGLPDPQFHTQPFSISATVDEI